MTDTGFDVDWVVIGSGFGGSVSALRLAEKGYSVLVLEQGRRWEDEDFAQTSWETAKAQWVPQLGMRGIMKITPFRHVNVLTGVGVGGGSLTWANTSYVPHSDAFYRHRQWADLGDWRAELAPHFATASRMLGVVEPAFDGPSERLMQGLAEDLGVPGSYRTTPVAVFMGEPGVEVEDPYFGGDGPAPHGLHAVRAVHPRLPRRREEHADEELPVVRRARGRADRGGAAGRERAAGRRV